MSTEQDFWGVRHPWIWRYGLPIISRFPDRLLKFLNRHWRLWEDPMDGWTLWIDADYAKYVRKDQKRAKNQTK